MDLKKIITISGEPDLFKLINSTAKGIIVESLLTQKRIQAFAHQRVNSLEDIAVYTETGEIPLREVFLKIYKKENGGQASVDHKEEGLAMKKYFEDFFPEYDKEKVKMSAMKRIIKWYNMLNERQLIDDKVEEEVKEDKKEEETKE